nr:glycosyltransferase family 2 protein [Marinococcus halophilus]
MNSNQPEKDEDLVSIVMPAYNCEAFIKYSLDSVIQQTYQNWELIIVDDGSKDSTKKIVTHYSNKDPRIKYFEFEKNQGAAVARNKAVELAEGKYMAFLDSDDIWFPKKLDEQLKIMKENGYEFTCTSYTKIDELGQDLKKTIRVTDKSTYDDILKRNLGNSTVIYNVDNLGKFTIPNIRKRNDYVMWLQVIKKAGYLYGINEALSSHRVRKNSLSKKKVNLVGYHWKVYREIEKLSLLKSVYLIMYWVLSKVLKF